MAHRTALGQGAALDPLRQRMRDLTALSQTQYQIRHRDRGQRRQAELPQPLRQRRHVAAEHDQVGGVGDRQHEAGRVGNERADEQVRQGIGTGRFAGHQRADQEDQVEQPSSRPLGMLHGIHGQPVEQAFVTRQLGQHHHADQEQVDVAAFRHCPKGRRHRYQAGRHQQRGRAQRPDIFGDAPGTEDDTAGGNGGHHPDDQGGCGNVHRWLRKKRRGWRQVASVGAATVETRPV